MAKTNHLTLIALLTTATLIAGCSESGTETITAPPASTQNEQAVDLDTLISQAEASREEADKLGFEWSVTAPLLEKAHAAAKAGNEEQAIALFQEVKYQSMLAIEQAHYAEKHWQLLIPSK